MFLIYFCQQKVKQSQIMKSIDSSNIYSIKCGAASFMATYIAGIMHPLDVLKTRFQSHDGKSSKDNMVPRYTGIFRGLSQIYKYEGIKGLFKGFYISLISQAMATAFFFLLYEKRKKDYELLQYDLMDCVSYASIQASIVATIITQPMWVIKTRMLLNIDPQVGEIQNSIKKSKEIYRQSGLLGFTKGLGVSLILSFNGVLQMYIYEGSKQLYQKFKIPESALSQKSFFCGSISKLITILFTYPLTTIRTRIQQDQFFNNRSQAKYTGIFDIVSKLIREEGVTGFYKGLMANLAKGVPQRGIYFYCYEAFKKFLCSSSPPAKP